MIPSLLLGSGTKHEAKTAAPRSGLFLNESDKPYTLSKRGYDESGSAANASVIYLRLLNQTTRGVCSSLQTLDLDPHHELKKEFCWLLTAVSTFAN